VIDVDTKPHYLNTFEAAEILGCSQRTVYRLIADGRLRCFKPTGRLRFRFDDVQALIAATEVVPAGGRE
jgi:excisionase family DNA binding protein